MENLKDIKNISLKDIASKDYLTLPCDSSLGNAMSLWRNGKNKFEAIIVTGSDSKVVGMFSSSVMIKHLINQTDTDLPLTKDVLEEMDTVNEDTPIIEVCTKGHKKFPFATVDSSNKLTGVIFSSGILKSIIQNSSNLQEELDRVRPMVKAMEMYAKNTSQGTAIINNGGIVLFANESFLRFFDISRSQFVNRPFKEMIKGCNIDITLNTGRPEYCQVIGKKKEAKMLNLCPIINDDDVIGTVGIIFSQEEFAERVKLVQKVETLQEKVEFYQRELFSLTSSRYNIENIIGESKEIIFSKRMALKGAESTSPVLVLGESGVGKELFAHAIHQASSRRSKDFIRINCATIPKELLEAELFRYEPGAFTGAGRKTKPGKFEMAHGGTIFLDEIGDMPLEMQAKLLRVLEEKEIERIGGTRPIRVDFRLITATHENLGKLVEGGGFREDLYYRVNVLRVCIPPLRQRRGDISLLINLFLEKIGRERNGLKWHMTEEAKNFLTTEYHWPGNVRELINVLERVTNWVESDLIDIDEILPFVADGGTEDRVVGPGYLKKVVSESERKELLQVLKDTGGNVRNAAEILGVHRTGLYKKIKKYDLKL